MRHADHGAVAIRRLDVADAEAAATGDAVLGKRRPLAVAVGGHGEHGARLADQLHGHDLVAVAQVDAAHAVRRASHRADPPLGEAQGHAVARADEDVLGTGRELHGDDLVILVHAHGDDAADARVRVRLEVGLLDHTLAGAHDDEALPFLGRELAHRHDVGDLLAGRHLHEVGNRLAAGVSTGIGNLVHAQPVGPATVRVDDQVRMRRRHEQVVDVVVVREAHADRAGAAAALEAVLVERRALDVALVAHRDRHVLVGDQVEDVDVARVLDDLGPARVAEAVAGVLELVDHDLHDQALAAENGAQALDLLQQFGELVEDLLAFQASEALELHVENRLRLNLRQAEVRHQALAGLGGILRAANQRDHRIEVVERDAQTFQDVGPRLCLAQFELGASPHDVAAELDEPLDQLEQRQHARPAIDDGQHDDAERRLQRRVLVEVVEHHLRHLAALEFDHDTHALAVGFVADVGDALERLLAHQVGDALDQLRLVDLIGDLGDDDRLPVAAATERLDLAARPHDDGAATGGIGRGDAGPADQHTAGREVGARDVLREAPALLVATERLRTTLFVDRERLLRIGDGDDPVDDLGEVVRRDVGRHADGDARRSVDEEVRDRRRQDRRLRRRLVEVGDEVDGVLVEVGHQRFGERFEAGLGVAVGGRAVAVDAAEVALAVDQRVPHVEALRETHEGVVRRRIAMRVVVADDLADDLGALAVRPRRRQTHLPHGEQHAPMRRLQTVPYVGQGTPDDHAHRVIHVRAAHLVFDVDGNAVRDSSHGSRRRGSSRRARCPR